MTAGRPSGIAATARPTAAMNMSARVGRAASTPNAKASAARARMARGQPAGEGRHLRRSGVVERLDLGEQRADPADLGGVAGGDDDARAPAHGRPACPRTPSGDVAERRVGGDRLGRLLDRDRLAGERRLLDLEVRGREPAAGRPAPGRPTARSTRSPGTRSSAGTVRRRPSRTTARVGRQHARGSRPAPARPCPPGRSRSRR